MADTIIITPEITEIELGGSVQLSAQVLPQSKSVKWSTAIGTTAKVSVTDNGLVAGILVGSGYVKASTSGTGGATARVDFNVVNPQGAVLVNKITLSPGTLSLKVGQKAKLTATITPSNASYKGIVWSVPQGAVASVDQEGNVTAVRKGSSRIIAKSADGNAQAWIAVNVAEADSSDDTSPIDGPQYVTFAMPTEVEVERGQEFSVWVRGLNTKTHKEVYNYVSFDGGFDFTPMSSQIEIIDDTSEYDTSQRGAWCKAGNIPGTYEIKITPREGHDQGYGTSTVKVKIVDKIFNESIARIVASSKYLSFVDDGVTPQTNRGQQANTHRIYIGYIEPGSSTAKRFTAEENRNIGWHILNDGIISKIEYDGSYLKINRGTKYGITQVIFYLKSNPHIYYPVWVARDGGNYQYYLTDGGRPWSTNPDEPTPGSGDTPSGGGDTPSGGGGSDAPAANSATFFTELGETEEITGITSVGNTLIVSTNENMYYYLWKNGQYNFLGNKIPIPAIHFRIGGLDDERNAIDAPFVPTPSSFPDFFDSGGNFKMFSFSSATQKALLIKMSERAVRSFSHENPGLNRLHPSKWGNSAAENRLTEEKQKQVLDSIWGEIDSVVNEQSVNGRAYFPVFVRYAVRLYDGTSYAQSIPILLGAELLRYIRVRAGVWGGKMPDGLSYTEDGDNFGPDDFFVLFPIYRNDEPSYSSTEIQEVANFMRIRIGLPQPYSICADYSYSRGLYDGWGDIVSGVDIFISTQIGPHLRDAARIDVANGFYAEDHTDDKDDFVGLYDIVIDPVYTEKKQEELMLLHQATYLAKSYSLDEFNALSGEVLLDDINFNSDHIMAQEPLKETPWSMHYTKGSKLFNYNKRLLMTGVEQVLSSGYQFLHSVKWNEGDAVMADSSFRFVYYLRGENGESVVISRDANGNALIQRQKKAVVSGDPTLYTESPYAWIAYPDSRCYKIEVYETKGNSVIMSSYTTRVFDQADVAYAFIGFGQQLNRPVDTDMSVDGLPSYENRVYNMPSSLVVSKVNNPFIFAAEDVVTFTAGNVMNLAVATRPLSEGQFGQFPLYVFTDEGVFALSTDNQGRFLTSHPVSRDVLVGDDALTGIEQGVFFAAARGLLLLQGSTVTKVSALMDGAPDELGPLFAQEISRSLLDSIAIESPARFSEFIKGCRMAYDYANSRIVLFRDGMATQYVYKFDTQSWHRMNAGIGPLVRALNSYPEALVVSKTSRGQSVYNISVTAESDDAVAVPGLVYSRDLILDGADIYKTIHRLKVRGRFRNGHVRWQLQGSNDGLNYKNIHSLRGPSWKWYRIVLVSRLSPNERVSYIELDYEPKFVDKIR